MPQIFRSPESIAPIVASQFPEFYREEGEGFIAFLKAYYEWLETQFPRNQMEMRDIDRTTDDFIIHFKNTYLNNIQFDVATNKRLLVKNSLDLYRAKGTERAIDLFTKLVYGKASTVYYPGDDIFRASDADYVQPQYIETSGTSRNVDLVGRQISGTTSGQTAFVERYIKRKTNVDYIHILYISNPTGEFIPGELLITDSVFSDSPVVIGSVTEGTVTNGGTGFAVGDICNFVSDRGRSGQCRITAIGEISGIVEFELVYGGWGFSTNAETIVSDVVITADVLSTSNTIYFPTFADANQQIVKLTYENANGSLTIGDNVDLLSNNTTTIASSIVVRSDVDTNNTGIVYVYTNANTTQISTIAQLANTFTANVTVVEDQLATGTVMGHSNTFQLSVANTTDLIIQGTSVAQYYPNNLLIANGVVSKVFTATTFEVTVSNGHFVSNSILYTTGNTPFGTVADVQGKVGLYQTNNVFYTGAPIIIANNTTTGNVVKTSAGHGAGFNIGSITNEEVIFRNTDFLSANTQPRLDATDTPMAIEPMMDVPLNAYAYGFIKNPQANSADTIWSTLNYQVLSIGTVATLTNVNPGEDYDENPIVLVYEPAVGSTRRYDYLISYSNASGNFFQGENIYQTSNTSNVWDITVADGSTFAIGQIVEQDVTANTVGVVTAKSSNSLTVSNVTGSGFVVGGTLYNDASGNSTITAAQVEPNVVVGYGKINSIDNANSVLYVARLSFDGHFDPGLTIVGESSGVTATITSVSADTSLSPIGYNAIVNANTVTSDSLAQSIQIVDSGIGYTKNENVTFYKVDDPSVVGEFRVFHNGVGFSQGYFRSTRGFASSNKYLFDGDFYQEYSYEVISSIPFDKYKDVLNKVLHVAGTKAFGAVLLENAAQYNLNEVQSEVTLVDA